jgi:hypothetical protein
MPTAAQFERAIELIAKGPSQYDYFFDNLDDATWIESLRERGFFSSPPPPDVSEEGEMHPRWSESQFLLRMVERDPEAVAAALRQIPETKNVRVLTDICRIAVALPPERRLEVGKRIRTETAGRALFFLLPEAIGELIIALAAAGEVKFALHFGRELLAVSEAEDKSRLRPRVAARMDGWEYERVISELVPELVPYAELGAVELAADLLQETIEGNGHAEPPRDHAEYWRPAIDDHEENRGDDTSQAIVSALRDAALRLVDLNEKNLALVFDCLRKRQWHLFNRIALFVVSQQPLADLELGCELALDSTLMAEVAYSREYDQLVAAVFPHLALPEQDEYLSRVELGPAINATEDPARDRQRVEVWQRDRLSRLVEHLPKTWLATLDDLVERYGEAPVGRFPVSVGTWSGPTSPMSKEEMESMSAEAVVDFLGTWRPENEMMTPTPEGLARVLSDRVEEAPADFASLAEKIIDLDPTYVRAVLRGLEQALKNDNDLPWGPALELVERAVESPSLDEPADVRERGDRDPDWRWARKDAASLLETAAQVGLLPPDFGARAWDSLEPLSWDSEPDLAYERQYGGSNMDPLTLSLNTTRGEAMHAVVAFAAWAKKQSDSELLELALENLGTHLDPTRESSETVRGVFGARLHQIHWVSSDWLRGQIGAIFPRDPELAPLRIAAWDTYLIWGRPSPALFEMLEAEYSNAVEELPVSELRNEAARKNPGQALAEHLATFLWWGVVGTAEEDLPARFFARAEPNDAGHLLDVLGRSLGDEENQPINPQVLKRLEGLWAEVPEWIGARPQEERDAILREFGSLFASGAFDQAWADRELLRLVSEGVLAGPDFMVFDRLAAQASAASDTAIRFALAFAENPPKPWALDARESEIRTIVEAGLESEKRELATQLINLLVAKGHRKYRTYLEDGKS